MQPTDDRPGRLGGRWRPVKDLTDVPGLLSELADRGDLEQLARDVAKSRRKFEHARFHRRSELFDEHDVPIERDRKDGDDISNAPGTLDRIPHMRAPV